MRRRCPTAMNLLAFVAVLTTQLCSLWKEDIRPQIRRTRLNQVRACYETGLIRRPELAGRVQAQFIIHPGGTVRSARIQSSSLNDSGVEACIGETVRHWQFRRTGMGPVEVLYPFVLRPTDDGRTRKAFREQARACWAGAGSDAPDEASVWVSWESSDDGYRAVSVEESTLSTQTNDCVAHAALRNFQAGETWIRFLKLGS